MADEWCKEISRHFARPQNNENLVQIAGFEINNNEITYTIDLENINENNLRSKNDKWLKAFREQRYKYWNNTYGLQGAYIPRPEDGAMTPRKIWREEFDTLLMRERPNQND